MKKTIYSLLISLIAICCSCKNSSTPNNNTEKDSLITFTLPEIPVMYTSTEQRADFLVKNYWKNYNFSDTVLIHHPEVSEQAWVDFINILPHVPMQTAHEGITKTFELAQADKKVYDYFATLADKYLYDPNSPFRNEEYYIPVLESIIQSDLMSGIEKIRPKARLELALKNRVGQKAIDFTYTLSSGKQGRLYNVSTDFTLLFFNNPGCHSCEETIESIKNSLQIQYYLSNKKLTILSVYPDEDLEEWKLHLSNFPKEWINGYDKEQTLKMKNLYDLKAIPTLYLLDNEKNVLLKDATFEAVEGYLREHKSTKF